MIWRMQDREPGTPLELPAAARADEQYVNLGAAAGRDDDANRPPYAG